MSKLSWGEPIIEFVKLENGAIPSSPSWTSMPEIRQGTTQLDTQEGNRTEALDEGGDLVDVRTAKSRYTLSMEVYVQKGADKPIEDTDGVITDEYAVRLTPEDEGANGFLLPRAAVTVRETWNSSDGGTWVYTFTAIKPSTGKTLQKYVKGQS